MLGWTADSGYDAELYEQLDLAPMLVVDARAKGSPEHAGFSELEALSGLHALRALKTHARAARRAPLRHNATTRLTTSRMCPSAAVHMHLPLPRRPSPSHATG